MLHTKIFYTTHKNSEKNAGGVTGSSFYIQLVNSNEKKLVTIAKELVRWADICRQAIPQNNQIAINHRITIVSHTKYEQ